MEGDKDMFHTLPMGDSSRNVDFKVFKSPLENCEIVAFLPEIFFLGWQMILESS